MKKRNSPVARMMYAASERDADLYYATRFAAPDPFLYFRVRGRSFILLSDLEYGRGIKRSSVDEVLRFSEIAKKAGRDAHFSVADGAAAFLKDRGVHRVEVPQRFPLALARSLEKRGILAVTGPEPFLEERSCKNRKEVEDIRRALRCTENAIHGAERVLRRSRIRGSRVLDGSRTVTSGSLRRLLHLSLAGDGLTAAHTIVACGDDACDPHSEGEGPIRPHRAIVMDVFPRSSGTFYWADITRTFVKGKPSPALRSQYEAVKAAQVEALSTVRAGVLAREVHAAAVSVLESRGYSTTVRKGVPEGFIHGLGHGVGLEIHEAPRLNASSMHRLRSGEVVTIEPGLYYPGVGGVRLEDMAVVTARGCVNLTRYPKRFVIP